MALSRSRTEFPLYVLNRLKSDCTQEEMDYTPLMVLYKTSTSVQCTMYSYMMLCVCVCVCVCARVCVPICRGTEICILQLVRTTALPAVSSRTTMGLSAGSFSMRSLTSYVQKNAPKELFLVATDNIML